MGVSNYLSKKTEFSLNQTAHLSPKLSGLVTFVAFLIVGFVPLIAFIFMDAKKGAQLIKKLREIGYIPKNIYFDQSLQWGLSDYQEILGNLSVLEGSKGLYSTSKMTDEFQAKYKARFKVEIVPSMAGLGYDSYMTMVANYSDNSNKWRSNMNKFSTYKMIKIVFFLEDYFFWIKYDNKRFKLFR
jgi:hypothetical protein